MVGLKPEVVDTYLKAACSILGVNGRHRAASMLAEHEAGPPPKLEFQSGQLAEPAVSPIMGPSDKDRDWPAGGTGQAVREDRRPYGGFSPDEPQPPFPIPWGKEVRNKLGLWQRMALIAAGAIALAIGFAGVMSALEVLGSLASEHLI